MLLSRTGRGTLNAYIGIRRKHITRTRPLSASEARRNCRASEADKGAIKRNNSLLWHFAVPSFALSSKRQTPWNTPRMHYVG